MFAAENIRTGRPVAVKLLRQDTKMKSSAIARFRQEARAAGSINSDHVTQVLDVEEDPEHGVVLVFELLEGESMIERLKRTGAIPLDELHPIIEQVWMGLADAHRVGIIHRDLKPSNVFLERRPDGMIRVKILDFGISKVPKEVGGETLTEMGQSLGTFSFMPPEQIGKAKMVDHRADIYACATLIYQSLTGQLPYAARNILVMVEMKAKSDARKLSEALAGPIDPRLEAFVARGLAREPAQRFQTALEALAAWRELRPQGPPSLRPVSGPGSGPGGGPGSGQPPSSGATRQGAPSSGSSSGSSAGSHGPPSRGTAIMELPAPRLPDLVELTTDETAATLAIPMPHLQQKKGQGGSHAPRLEPRLVPLAASAGGAPQTPRPAGPGGTQPVMISRMLERAAERRPGANDATVDEKSGNLPAHPAGYYIPPSVAASLARATPQSSSQLALAQLAPPPGPPPPATPPGGVSPVPRMYDDPTSLPVPSSQGATQVYRPHQDETARRLRPEPAIPVPVKPALPLFVVLLGFLVVGFLLVAGVLYLLRRHG